jgi:hypothetical protein
MIAASWVAVAVLALSPTAPLADPEKADITGEYAGAGTDINGAKYTVTVKIEEDGDTFKVTWKMPDGQSYIGVGIRNGKLLSVSWATQAGTRLTVGVTVYEVQKNATLKGRWSMIGAKGKVSEELLTPSA